MNYRFATSVRLRFLLTAGIVRSARASLPLVADVIAAVLWLRINLTLFCVFLFVSPPPRLQEKRGVREQEYVHDIRPEIRVDGVVGRRLKRKRPLAQHLWQPLKHFKRR